MKKPNAARRWELWQANQALDFEMDPYDRDWARRGDGAVMLQDEFGWFALPVNSVGIIGAQTADPNDPDQEIYTIYCEPIWLEGFADREYERGET